MTRIEDLSWKQFGELAPRSRLALVPNGAVEPNGRHMAQGLDNHVSVALADAVAERTGGFAAPLIPVGYSARLEGFPGLLTVEREVFEAYCEGIARSLIATGLDRILFVCGHGGNDPAIENIAHKLEVELPGCHIAYVDLWKFLQPLSEDLAEGTRYRFGHAGEMPTSLLLHLRPDLVDMTEAALELPEDVDPYPMGTYRPTPFRRRMPNGALGDVSLATAEKGRILFERMTDALVEYVSDPDFDGLSVHGGEHSTIRSGT
jgi:creatinine amidohydrolase